MTRLDEIKARAETATPGQWLSVRSVSVEVDDGRGSIFSVANQRDATFIAHARSDVPWLVSEVERLDAALRAAWTERDAYKKAKAENDERFMNERDAARAERDAFKIEVDEKHWDVSELSLELMQARHERDARPDAATVAKVRVLLGCIETHSGLCATMRDLDCDCEHGEANDDAREALRLLEGKP